MSAQSDLLDAILSGTDDELRRMAHQLDPDHIRAAIDAADERAILLRRLLRVVLRLRLNAEPAGPTRLAR